jgi:hypothetical protein
MRRTWRNQMTECVTSVLLRNALDAFNRHDLHSTMEY